MKLSEFRKQLKDERDAMHQTVAIQAELSKQNRLAEWFAARVELDQSSRESTAALWSDYCARLTREGCKPPTHTLFSQMLRSVLGLQLRKSGTTYAVGVRMRTAADPVEL